jgi:hypothetical protein
MHYRQRMVLERPHPERLPEFDPGKPIPPAEFWPCMACCESPCVCKTSLRMQLDREAHRPLCVLCATPCDTGCCLRCEARLDAEESGDAQ